jgi:hypothetical protein
VKSARGVRRIFVSALLGLPAALLAHALAFGQAHVLGGTLHSFAVQGAAGFALIAAIVASLAIARGERWDAPHAGAVAIAASAWLTLIELAEAPHAVPLLLCVLAILAATAIVSSVAAGYTHAVAAVVHVFGAHAKIDAPRFAFAFSSEAPSRRRTLPEFRLFSRPPPAFS